MADNLDLLKISKLNKATEIKNTAVFPIVQDNQTLQASVPLFQQTVIDKVTDGFIRNEQKGAPNGIAPLDADSKVPNENLNFGKVEEGNSDVVSGEEVYKNILFNDVSLFQKPNYVYDLTTGDLSFTTTLILVTKNNFRVFIGPTNFSVIAKEATNGSLSVVFIDIPNITEGKTYTTTLKTSLYNSLPNLETNHTRILLGISENSVEKRFNSIILDIYKGGTNTSRKRLIQVLEDQIILLQQANVNIFTDIRNQVGQIDPLIRGNLKSYSFSNSTGIYTNNSLITVYDNMGRRKFLVSQEGESSFRITNFKTIPDNANGNSVYIIYADLDIVNGGNLVLKTSLYTELPLIPNNTRRILFGFAYKNNNGQISFRSDLLQVYEELGSDITRIQQLFRSDIYPDDPKKIVLMGDSIFEFWNVEQVGVKLNWDVINIAVGGTRLAKHNNINYDKLSAHYLVDVFAGILDYTEVDLAVEYIKNTFADDNTEIVNRMKGINWESVDVLVVPYGTNDFTGENPLGIEVGVDSNTIRGALNKVVKVMTTKYPNIKIVFGCPTHRFFGDGNVNDSDLTPNGIGLYLKEYAEAIEHQSKINHCPVLNLYKEGFFNSYNHSTFFKDGVHPNSVGYEVLLGLWNGFLKSKFL